VEHPEPDAVPIGVDREERIVLERGQFGLLDLEERGQPWRSRSPTSPPLGPENTATTTNQLLKGGTGRNAEPLIPLSANEIRRLLATLVLAPLTCVDQVFRWSHWRRRRQ
jgi:hypothetical protein